MTTANNDNFMKNANNIVNQNIKSAFVQREVYAQVNEMVQYILNKSHEDNDAPFSWDDVENLYSFPEWSGSVLGEDLFFEGGTQYDKDTFLENFDRLIEETENLLECEEISEATYERNIKLIEEAKEEFEQATEDSEQREIYEYWLVSGWLCEKLAEKGECVIRDHNIWCRGTTGQAILLDYVISQICYDMKILEGMENTWENWAK